MVNEVFMKNSEIFFFCTDKEIYLLEVADFLSFKF